MDKIEKIKQKIINHIINYINLYNQVSDNEQLRLIKEEKKYSISDLYVCSYNEKNVGLFKKTKAKTYSKNNPSCYDSYDIYFGLNQNNIGIKITHLSSLTTNIWKKINDVVEIEDHKYIATCDMFNALPLNDLRLIMFKNNKIGPYDFSFATKKEIEEVLDFAATYFQQKQNNPKR